MEFVNSESVQDFQQEVVSSGEGGEFVAQIPSTVTGAEGEDVDELAQEGIPVGEYCVVIPPESQEDARLKAPVDRVVIPSDVIEINEDDEQVYVIGTRDGKVTQIVGLEKVRHLKVS
jgi:hypothetical protein